MQNISLVGKWKLVRDGSDFMPGVDTLKGAPVVLKLLGKAESEFYKIEKKRQFDVDEVSLTYVAKNTAVVNSYQLGTLNFESASPTETIFGIVQNCNSKFTEFTIHRLGPGCGQSSREIYTLNSAQNEIKLEVEVNSGEGMHIKLIKYLVRFDASQVSNDVVFQSHHKTHGWNRYEFWPSSVLSECKVLIVKAVKIQTCNPKTGQDHKVLEVLWTRAGFTDDFKLNLDSMARHQATKREGEEVIIFLVQVTVNNTTWYVAHRYTEFSVLKGFLMQQNPYIAEFKDVEEKFPGKAVGLSYRRSVLERRIEGLGAFLVFFLRNSRFCRQTSVDAVCSFLVVPENLCGAKSDSIPALPAPTAGAPNGKPGTGVNGSADTNKGANGKTAVAAGAKNQPSLPEGADGTAQRQLWAVLGKKGMAVIKHGRQGAPKQRVLHCSPDATLLYWGEKSNYKSIFLDQVEAIRCGLDVDPATPPHLVPPPAHGVNGMMHGIVNGFVHPTAHGGVASGANGAAAAKQAAKAGVLYGTETLRRNCKHEDLALCFSLILPTRTFDIQCKNQQDFNNLLSALRDVCPPPQDSK